MSNELHEKRIRSGKLNEIEHECTSCRDHAIANSTGYIIKYNNSKYWYLEFQCKDCGEVFELWNEKYEDLIQEVLREKGITDK